MTSLRVPDFTNSKDKIQLSRLSHVYFEHPNLKEFTAFAEAFGFIEADSQDQTIYFRGYGRDQYVYVASQSSNGEKKFKGAAFVAASAEDFEKAKALENSSVEGLRGPGGGTRVTINRPGNTFLHIIYGQKDREAEVKSAIRETKGDFNLPFEKPRKGELQNYHSGPALVHKLGHYGYICTNFDEEVAFYMSNFNFKPSDILYSAENHDMDVLTFLHLDLGEEYSDHHCLFLGRAPPETPETYIHHSSYEIEDFDTQMMGHEYLLSKSYTPAWGVGRHTFGSQLFDYWLDTSGFKIEHYADGDVVNEAKPIWREEAGPLAVWGPEFPKTFMLDQTKDLPGL